MQLSTSIALAVGATAVLAGAVLWTPDVNRAELESSYLQSPDDMRLVLGNRMHVRDRGPRTAPAVLMIHGFGSSLQTWDAWAAALSDEWRVVRLDLPGSGLSGPDSTNDYTDARTHALLAELLDQLGLGSAALVGHSIGGRIAWSFAASYPDRVDRLVLVAPDGFASPGFEYGAAPEIPASLGLMRYVLPKFLLRMNLEVAYGNPDKLSAEMTQTYYDLLRAPGNREALLARLRQTVLRDPVPLLERVRAPVLLLWGESDQMIPVANSADYQAHLEHVELVRVPGLGHVPQEEAPAETVGYVERFLRQPATVAGRSD
ncbi:MAG: alpha/beta fold hydrolase [Gammaproteobacteria bacterium]|nr:alpha/beta fold hydrolase [Gammaproteobacteria bacterium]